MSGHSKWSTIKHKKAKKDAQRGKLFSKLVRKITIEAKHGGGDVDKNPALRLVVDQAQDAGMPKDNIKKAIQRGTGELPGVNYEEVAIEGYGPGGTALLIEAVTDNRRRTIAQIRHLLTSHDGHIGETGCVNWLFDRKGAMVLDREEVPEDTAMDLAIALDAEDIREEEDSIELVFAADQFHVAQKQLREHQLPTDLASITMIPQTTIPLEEKEAIQMLKLMEALEDTDEIENVYANFDISEEVMEKALE